MIRPMRKYRKGRFDKDEIRRIGRNITREEKRNG